MSDSPQVKGNLISSITILVYELPHELPNDLRLKILRVQEILEKKIKIGWRQNLMPVAFKKFDFGNNSQNSRKNRYQTFLFLFNFTGFPYFAANILSRLSAQADFCSFLSQFLFKLQFFDILYSFKALLGYSIKI